MQEEEARVHSSMTRTTGLEPNVQSVVLHLVSGMLLILIAQTESSGNIKWASIVAICYLISVPILDLVLQKVLARSPVRVLDLIRPIVWIGLWATAGVIAVGGFGKAWSILLVAVVLSLAWWFRRGGE